MDRRVAPKYIRDNFESSDRLAVVLLNKRTGAVTQRIASAERMAAPDFQAWLRHKNAQKQEVYISMNALRPGSAGRTKNDIAVVRHLYLDFDESGTEAVARTLARQDLPRPSYRISTSPGKWQIVWKVEGFAPDRAEALQKWLALETGADRAATDCARVLRLPGFYNHKYANPHFVSAESLSWKTYGPESFPEPERRKEAAAEPPNPVHRARGKASLSQSEHDWAYAKRALSRGDSPSAVVIAIARHRQDKHDPEYYAAHTVRRAAASLGEEQLRRPNDPRQPER
jgi:DNA primase RepB-like protein